MPDTYGEFLHDRRRSRGLSQEALAARVAHVPGLKQSHISKFEAGEMLPSNIQARALAVAMQLDEDDARQGEELLRRQHLARLGFDPDGVLPGDNDHQPDGAASLGGGEAA
jgi:transcriptional regulator with XRE-family HTH domain